MMLKEKLLKPTNLIVVLVILFLTTLILGGIIISSSGQKHALYQELDLVKLDLEKQENQLKELKEILQIDGLIIIDQAYEDALTRFKKVLEDNPNLSYKELVKLRMEILAVSLSSSDNKNDQAIQDLLRKKNQEIANLKNALDTIPRGTKVNMDSIQFVLDGLKLHLQKKEEKLKQKEQIQVLTFKNSKGKIVRYLGEVKNGKANGGGVGIFETGSVYKGNWGDNLKHGEGEYEWTDGSKYKGAYYKDVRTGFGVYYWASGERYEGQWLNDRRKGLGKQFDRDGNLKFEGNWEEDKIVK